MRYACLLIFLSATVLSSCASSNAVQDNLGKAVAQMERAQVSNQATLSGNQDNPVEGLDPQAATIAVESMRKDTPDRTVVKHDIMINVGAQQASAGNQ